MKRISAAEAYDFVRRNRIKWDVLKGSPDQMPPTYRAIASVPGNHKMLIEAYKFLDTRKPNSRFGNRVEWFMDKTLLRAFQRAHDQADLKATAGWLKAELKRQGI